MMSEKLRDLLTDAEMKAIRLPIENARTFPSRAYTSDRFFSLEVEKIFMRHWAAVCFTFDVPNSGDVYPFSYCDIPLVAVRGDDGSIRVFHNISPYDGCPLVLEPTTGVDFMVSPYHGWRYDLKGRLVSIPFWDGTRKGNLSALEGKDVNLVPVDCDTFLETVFINLSESSQPFADYIAPIERQFSDYDFDIMAVGTDDCGAPLMTNHDRMCNWKTFYENSALNILHENFVHDIYLISPEVPRIKNDGVPSFMNIVDQDLLALGFDAQDFTATYFDTGLPHLGKDGKEPQRDCFGTHYPNFYISFAPTFVEVTSVLPDGHGRVLERQAILYHRDAASDPAFLKRRKMVSGFFDAASSEDGRICEAVQAARKSPVFDQKFYSPFWDELHYRLNKRILDDLER